jgi:hypothetical protein
MTNRPSHVIFVGYLWDVCVLCNHSYIVTSLKILVMLENIILYYNYLTMLMW